MAKAITRLVGSLNSAVYLGQPQLFPWLAYMHVNQSLRNGTEAYSAFSFSTFAVMLSALGRTRAADDDAVAAPFDDAQP